MSADEDGDSLPRSMRHRQVLDAAEEHPDASIDEIASMVPSATPDLVEHVFDEHGDPAAEMTPEQPTESTGAELSGADAGEDPLHETQTNTSSDLEAVKLLKESQLRRRVMRRRTSPGRTRLPQTIVPHRKL